jgi:hypothetical protein
MTQVILILGLASLITVYAIVRLVIKNKKEIGEKKQ